MIRDESDHRRVFESAIEAAGGIGSPQRELVTENAARYRRNDGSYADPVELDGVGHDGLLIYYIDLSELGFERP